MALVSICIPSRKERFLNETIKDVLSNATGEIEIFPIIDGYELPDEDVIKDIRVKYIHLPDNGWMQKRQGINAAVSISQGKYVMSLDAHCMVSKGFDEILVRDCEDNMVMIPRRYKLDPLTWTTKNHLDGSLPVDYEYWLYNDYINNHFLKPHKWDARAIERKDIMIDDTLTMQASCWFMSRTWFDKRGFMRVKGYTGWGNEDVEICMETHINGGRVVVNKNCWYAHLYKGKDFGRMYKSNFTQWKMTKAFGHYYWTVEKNDEFLKVLEKFMPIPNWPEDIWN
jgi:hypothetical protein